MLIPHHALSIRQRDPVRLRGYDFGVHTPDWVTSSGSCIPLAEMTSAHIRAAMRYIHVGDGEYGRMERLGCSGFTNAEWLRLMAAELRRRARAGRD